LQVFISSCSQHLSLIETFFEGLVIAIGIDAIVRDPGIKIGTTIPRGIEVETETGNGMKMAVQVVRASIARNHVHGAKRELGTGAIGRRELPNSM